MEISTSRGFARVFWYATDWRFYWLVAWDWKDFQLQVPKHAIVKLVTIKLRGGSFAWWGQMKRSQDKNDKSKIIDWEKMKCRFLPFSYTQTLFLRLHMLRQGMRSIDDYTEKFYQLVVWNDLAKTEEQFGTTIFRWLTTAPTRCPQPSIPMGNF